MTGCLFVAMQNMEEWEEAVFDKTKNVIELKTFSLYTLILTMWRRGQEKGEEHHLMCPVQYFHMEPPLLIRVDQMG